ncbi:hypothetical protein HK105_202747 [Polyrhizophydium stewartii]|uniref:Uncharacterized protein n=1 Tax=Polyrhizophydium stewartii TaxID=2732419 RepID=A0ABR4NEB2_9FUNG|nr:hypothetical protein HK105_008323 [Polyrhizophydium stewartii]
MSKSHPAEPAQRRRWWQPAPPSSENVCPQNTAGFFSRYTYTWMDALFIAGWRRPLEETDIWQLPPSLRSHGLGERLTSEWDAELAQHGGLADAPLPPPPHTADAKAGGADAKADQAACQSPQPPEGLLLRRAMVRALLWDLVPSTFLKFAADVCTMAAPYVVKEVINFVSNSKHAQRLGITLPDLGQGIGYAVLLFVLQLSATTLQNRFFFEALCVGVASRVALANLVYNKAMRLSSASRQIFSSGKVTNLISTDVQRFEQFIAFLPTIITATIQIIVTTILLIIQIGPAALAGVAVIALYVPFQNTILKTLARIRKRLAPLTDSRVRKTLEILQGIRVLKFFTWETSFLESVEAIRKTEIVYTFQRSVVTAFTMTFAFAIPSIAASLSFIIYGLNNDLDPARIFSSLSWFNQLPLPLWFIPQVVTGYADVKIALVRTQEFLLAPEIEDVATIKPNAAHAVEVVDGEFDWEAPPPAPINTESALNKPRWFVVKNKGDKKGGAGEEVELDVAETVADSSSLDTPRSTLRNINLAIPRGKLVAVVGSVGSGKSSLLNALVGEMKRVKGSVTFSSRIGYAPQQAWIQNASVKDNILFGQPLDEERYRAVIRDCSLEKDLEILADGDLTQIGERGINLSGGQKQRVNLARMVYFNADIVLLDDPLSAVDAHVGRALFDNCIQGALAGKTRILVTHQLHFLPRVDYVVVMSDGEIAEQGTFSELMAANGEFATLMRNYGGIGDSESDDASDADRKDESEIVEEVGDAKGPADVKEKKEARELMQTEDRATGTVDGQVWLSYSNAAGGIPFLFGLLLMILISQGASSANDVWLVLWTNQSLSGYSQKQYITVYGILAVTACLLGFVYSTYVTFFGSIAARRLHEAAARRIVRAPVSFFDTTPLGRIINRFSKDQDGIDSTLIESFRVFIQSFASIVSVFITVIVSTPTMTAVFVPVIAMYYLIQLVYRKSSRELKRIESIARSPFYAHMSETLNGIATVRAYREQDRFIARNSSLIDRNTAPYFLLLGAARWMSIRFEFFGSLLIFFTATLGILSRETSAFTAALFGLSLSYALQVTNTLNRCIRQFTDTEISMNAVERIAEYANRIPVEAAEITDVRPPAGWPAKGEIEFKDVSMRYAPDLPLVLKSVSFSIHGREKIGVVGRTGSGKSSLMQVLFRMVEPASGAIVVDGITTNELGLKDLRSGLGIIPQDPVLFSGTFRRNLDPFGEHTDAELWDALERANIKAKVAESNGGLDGEVQENGENLSVGQRQLVCLARAMLKKPRVLVMDEATANVDYETDAIIQKCLREDFGDSTILTIAHRLNTIADYDRVMVLSAGEIVEFDTPQALVAKEGGVFRSMVNETGPQNVETILRMIRGEL